MEIENGELKIENWKSGQWLVVSCQLADAVWNFEVRIKN